MNQERTFLQWQPVFPATEFWQVALLALVCLALASFAARMVWRDSVQLSAPLRWLLVMLRLAAVGFLIVYLFNPGLRSETRLVTPSRLAILVDTSLSMGLSVPDQPIAGETRMDQCVQLLQNNDMIVALQQQHDLVVYATSDSGQPRELATLNRPATGDENETAGNVSFFWWRIVLPLLSIGLALLAGVLGFRWFTARSNGPQTNRLVALVSVVVLGLVAVGLTDLSQPNRSLLASFLPTPELPTNVPSQLDAVDFDDAKPSQDWVQSLAASGTSSPLGSCLQYLINRERGGSLAGVVVMTDGQNNSGVTLTVAAAAAANARLPVFPVGVGDNQIRKNLEIVEVQAPTRVFPDDRFKIKAILQGRGMQETDVRVELVFSQSADQTEIVADDQLVTVTEGQAMAVEFELQASEQGKRNYTVRISDVPGDLDVTDNQRSVSVDVVQRQSRVLLIAGGPMREFRFLRNQLYRDPDIQLDVWLQTAREGADQEADQLLFDFPIESDVMDQYDCLIAFDPDWRLLDETQTATLERWVAEQAGGLIVIAGPVNTPEWTRRPRGDESIDRIRQMYPVSFFSQGSAQLKLGRFGGVEPFPLKFSREGRAARFLWLADSLPDSAQVWDSFQGVFGYYAVNESKPGADILARFSDPDTEVAGALPIYLASQFYGAGRVLFQASGEMWRVRSLDVDYFRDYYNQVIRWASQGRLLRDSTRGVLLTDRDRCWLGDQVVVQAILRDNSNQPMMTDEVEATLKSPQGISQTLTLKPASTAIRPGTFTSSFVAGEEGEYQIGLLIPDSVPLEELTTTVRATIPDLEKARPQRNDAALSSLAERTGGHYFAGIDEFTDRDSLSSPTRLISAQDLETYLTGVRHPGFHRKLMIWLLVWIVTTLCFEWTVRRLHRLS